MTDDLQPSAFPFQDPTVRRTAGLANRVAIGLIALAVVLSVVSLGLAAYALSRGSPPEPKRVASDCSRAGYPGWRGPEGATADRLIGENRATAAAADQVVVVLGQEIKDSYSALGLYIEERNGLVWRGTDEGIEVVRAPIHTIVVILPGPDRCPHGPTTINEVPLSFVVRAAE